MAQEASAVSARILSFVLLFLGVYYSTQQETLKYQPRSASEAEPYFTRLFAKMRPKGGQGEVLNFIGHG